MIALKDYQHRVLDSLREFFRLCSKTGNPAHAFSDVCKQNGVFQEHLLNAPASREADLLKGPDGKPVPSLVNMLRLRRPVVIVDEAHNARTDLSFAALGDVMPSCIVEFTATPARSKQPSTILHHVSAAELKAANMVKLPLRVVTRHPSQKDPLLADAVSLRADLEKLALTESQATGDYLRPIMRLVPVQETLLWPQARRAERDHVRRRAQRRIQMRPVPRFKAATAVASSPCPPRNTSMRLYGRPNGYEFAPVSGFTKHAIPFVERATARNLNTPLAKQGFASGSSVEKSLASGAAHAV